MVQSLQKEIHYLTEKLSIDIEVLVLEHDAFLIKYANEREAGNRFVITVDDDLILNLLKEFEKKFYDISLKSELKINNVSFDFFRNHTLYFDVNFENVETLKTFHARMQVFYRSNSKGNLGEIYAFNLVNFLN